MDGAKQEERRHCHSVLRSRHDMKVTTVDITATGRTQPHKLLQLVPPPQQLPHTAAGDLGHWPGPPPPFCSPLFAKWLTPCTKTPQ